MVDAMLAKVVVQGTSRGDGGVRRYIWLVIRGTIDFRVNACCSSNYQCEPTKTIAISSGTKYLVTL